MDSLSALKIIKEAVPHFILSDEISHGEAIIIAKREHLLEIAGFLKNDERLSFNLLCDLFGVDYPKKAERIEVIYNFYSVTNNCRIFVKVRSKMDETGHPSLTPLYNAANWFEREVYDMFGLKFQGHPDMKRILNPDDWDGHPLLKDYPLRKRPTPDKLNYDTPGYVELDKLK